MEQYKEVDGEKVLRAKIDSVLAGEVDFGLVLVMTPTEVMDFALKVTTVQVRDALLNYCRDLATYKGD